MHGTRQTTGQQLSIRTGNMADLAALQEIETAQFDAARYADLIMDHGDFRHFLEPNTDGDRIFVAERDGAICGYVAVEFNAEDPGTERGSASLYSFAVTPDSKARSLGRFRIARMLIQAAEESVRDSNDHHALHFETHAANRTVIQGMQRFGGFEVFGHYPDFYSDGSAAVRLRKTLNPAPDAVTIPDHQETAAQNKREKSKPHYIINAEAALEQLRAAKPDQAQSLAKALKAFAAKLDKAGWPTDTAILLDHAHHGKDHIDRVSADLDNGGKRPRSYADIVAGLNAGQTTEDSPLDDHLFAAAEEGDLDGIRALHAQGADIHACSDHALRRAAANGHLDVVQYLHAKGADIHALVGAALRLASPNGHLDIVQYLVEQGADIHALDDEPLRRAAGHGHLDIVRYLVEQGADIHADDDQALYRAARNGHRDVAQYLVEQGADIHAGVELALRKAAENGHLDIVRYLHAQDADIHVNNDAALRSAAANGHLGTVQYLHAKGADIHAFDDAALRSASEYGHLGIVQYLVEKGANIHAHNENSLRRAAGHGHLDVAQYLHQQGADIHAYNNMVLGWAGQNGHLDVVQYLAEQGANIDATGDPESLRARLNRLEKWQDTQPQLAAFHSTFANAGFNPWLVRRPKQVAALRAAYDRLGEEGYKGAEGGRYAYQLAALFGKQDRILDYLEKWGRPGQQPLHDIANMIDVPRSITRDTMPDMDVWGDAVMKHGPKMARFVTFADKLPRPCTDVNGQGWSLANTRAEVAKYAYKGAQEHPELAGLCLSFGWDEEAFNEALETVKQRPSQADGQPDSLPDIRIDGARFGKPDMVAYKLPEGDVRGLLLGEFTDCCQHLANEAGAEFARHGFLAGDSGFYVIARRDTDEIVGQSWAWLGQGQELVLDSLEGLGDQLPAQSWQDLCAALGVEIGQKHSDITALRVGTGSSTPAMNFNIVSQPAMPADPGCPQSPDTAEQYDVPLAAKRSAARQSGPVAAA